MQILGYLFRKGASSHGWNGSILAEIDICDMVFVFQAAVKVVLPSLEGLLIPPHFVKTELTCENTQCLNVVTRLFSKI